MLTIFLRLASALTVPFMVLTFLGSVFSGIWLGILGLWQPILYGALLLVASVHALGLAFAPAALFARPASRAIDQGDKRGMCLYGALGSLYSAIVITVWCLGLVYFFWQLNDESATIPTLIWAYGIATAPLAYIANKEVKGGGGIGAVISTFYAQLAFVVTILAFVFLEVSFVSVIVVFACIMAFSTAVQVSLLVHSIINAGVKTE